VNVERSARKIRKFFANEGNAKHRRRDSPYSSSNDLSLNRSAVRAQHVTIDRARRAACVLEVELAAPNTIRNDGRHLYD